MEKKDVKTICPSCNVEIDVDEILSKQYEDEYKKKLSLEKQKFDSERQKLEEDRERFSKEKEDLEKTVTEGVEQRLKTERASIEEKLRLDIQKEQSEQYESLQKELNEKSEQLKDYHKSKAEVEKLKREKEEIKDKIEAESELKLNQQLTYEKEKIQKSVEDNMELRISEKDKLIEDLSKQLTEAKRKAEQGSQQLQGEVQELAIEEYLKKTFPLDRIEEVKKGKKGADCLQVINTEYAQNCGSIYYESKRTKLFQSSWVDKLKSDMREMKASVGVIVTETMPAGMVMMGQIDGIWVCSLREFRSLSLVLRESIVRVSDALSAQDNKGDKMSLLYDFLTSDEFKNHIKDIADAFIDMENDLNREKRAMEGLWKKREKQNQKVLTNLNMMFNSIKGIAGNSLGTITTLELPSLDKAENDSDLEVEKDQDDLF